jgi:hypothetical protein
MPIHQACKLLQERSIFAFLLGEIIRAFAIWHEVGSIIPRSMRTISTNKIAVAILAATALRNQPATSPLPAKSPVHVIPNATKPMEIKMRDLWYMGFKVGKVLKEN